MAHFLDYLADRVVLCDGAMGTQVQARNLDVERDFLGLENCTEIVCESRPDLVRAIHRGYLEAGCDAVQFSRPRKSRSTSRLRACTWVPIAPSQSTTRSAR